jgi:hypothetical protein
MGSSAGVADWTDHVKSLGEGLLMNEIDSGMTGVNRNVEGKQARTAASPKRSFLSLGEISETPE